MKKSNFNVGIIFFASIFVFFLLTFPVFAEEKVTGRISSTTGVKLRSGPGTSYDRITGVPHNARVTILSYVDGGNDSGCEDEWAQIIYDDTNLSYTGYICSTYIEDIETEIVENPTPPASSEMANMTEEEFEAYLDSQGFPESYKVKLRALHKIHPTWIFKGVKTEYTWDEVLSLEGEQGRNLYNVNQSAKEKGLEGYLSTAPGDYDFATDTFFAHDGVYWFQANIQTIGYYIDPRNFLTENYVFMFEDLLYDPSYQNIDTINKILTSEFMQQYSQYFLEAAQTYNVSPMFLASLSRQEVGLSDTNIVTNGKAGVLSDGVDYTGYYNFFNHGASSSPDPKLKSLQAAKEYKWNNPRISIIEGTYLIAYNYIMCGQYTSYFQRFNLSPTATKGIWHQYDTNIISRLSPASTTFSSYRSMGILEQEFSFSIPIYENMPESTTLPNLGNPNNWLKELKVNNTLVTNFSGGTVEYSVTVPYSDSVTIDASTVNSNAKIEGIGQKKLTGDKTTFTITVTAQNGDVKTYNITINREEEENIDEELKYTVTDVLNSSGLKYDDYYLWNITLATDVSGLINTLTKDYKTVSINIQNRDNQIKNEGTIVTGDKVTISINGDSKTLEVVIFGDNSGDGNISAIDLLNIQKHILGYTTLLGPYYRATDINKDSNVSAYDLLQVQKHILGYINISQQ